MLAPNAEISPISQTTTPTRALTNLCSLRNSSVTLSRLAWVRLSKFTVSRCDLCVCQQTWIVKQARESSDSDWIFLISRFLEHIDVCTYIYVYVVYVHIYMCIYIYIWLGFLLRLHERDTPLTGLHAGRKSPLACERVCFHKIPEIDNVKNWQCTSNASSRGLWRRHTRRLS